MDLIVSELKNNLHRLVVETDDVSILEKVQEYFGKLKSNPTDWWETLSLNEKESIERGLQQLDRGERIPHSEVRQKVKELLHGQKGI
jgi:hypothetical protein